MNEESLPKVYHENDCSDAIEEELKMFYEPSFTSQCDFHWIIDFIGLLLNSIVFQNLSSLNKEERNRIKEYRKEKKEQLENLSACEHSIEQNTNTLLNLIADSNNHTGNESDLTSVYGYNRSEIQISNNLISRPIQDLLYTLSSQFCSLIKCAMCTVELYHNVNSLLKKDNQTLGNEFYDKMAEMRESLSQVVKTMQLHDNRERNHYESTNKHIDRFYRGLRRNKITQKDCAETIYHIKNLFFIKRKLYLERHKLPCIQSNIKYSVPEEKSIERKIQRWDKMCNERRESKICPPDGYSREKNYSDFYQWMYAIEDEKYKKWQDHIVMLFRIKDHHQGLVQTQETEDEENPENERSIQDQNNKNLVDLLSHNTRKD